MITKIVEAASDMNWGKFMLCRFDEAEWKRSSITNHPSLLQEIGWDPDHLWVLDLQTGEGALFRPHGYATADLNKHKIWVCPLYEPFLNWLYEQDLKDIQAIPDKVDIKAEGALWGYRRPGPNK